MQTTPTAPTRTAQRWLLAVVLLVPLVGLDWFGSSQAIGKGIDGLIEENARSAGVVLQKQEQRVLGEALKLVEKRYLTKVGAQQVLDDVMTALSEQANRTEEGITDEDAAAARGGAPTGLERIDEALNIALRGLDAHTAYLNPDAYREMQVRTEGKFGGLGLEVTMGEGAVRVVAPIDDTPAQRAGMQAGDLITHVDGTLVDGMTLRQAVMLMRGDVGTSVRLTVAREGVDTPLTIDITRDIIRIRPVRFRREGDVGYIRLSTFSQRAERGIERAVATLRNDGEGELKGLVIDLRNNPGGLLDQAVRVADAFLDDGNIVSVRGRQDKDNARYDAVDGDVTDGGRLVVLVNAGSASASEIVAGALQDHGRATVIGSRSFGKGSVQTILTMGKYGAMRLTTALYYTPSGRAIQARGVEPDLRIDLPDDDPRKSRRVRREENLTHALANPASDDDAAAAVPEIDVERCNALLDTALEDGELACALALLRLGGLEQLASAAERL